MFKSLRSRLLLSYTTVLGVALFMLALGLLGYAAVSDVDRAMPALRELATVNNGVRRTLTAMRAESATPREMQVALLTIAEEQGVRILQIRVENREVLADTNREDSWVGLSLENTRALTPLGQAVDNEWAGRFRAPDGGQWLVYAQPLAIGVSPTAWVVAQPDVAADEFFRQLFLRPLCLSGFFSFVVALFLAWLISRSISRPLRMLARVSAAIADGDYEQRVTPGGPAELRSAANSFNAMADRVQSTQQAQRDFVANVSHDLKTPLTSIRGWSQAMLDGMVTNESEQRRAAGVIHTEAERMARLVDQLLDLARIDAGQFELRQEVVDIAAMLGSVHQNMRIRARDKGIRLTRKLDAVPPLTGDRDRLMQVFSNLVDNAISHTPPGGRVHLGLSQESDHAILITVQDTGPGIPPEELDRIFERFYQTDRSRVRTSERRGAGLGLAIVNEVVAAHGGRVEARSRLGEGSAFLVRLPLAPPGATLARRAS
jgi:signal transduction histidine kinase